MLTYRCCDNTCIAKPCLFREQISHYTGIFIIEVTNGLIEYNKIKWLAQRTYQSDSLLLPP